MLKKLVVALAGIGILVGAAAYAWAHQEKIFPEYKGGTTVQVTTTNAVGSGVYIGEGFLLTAYHVVTDEKGKIDPNLGIITDTGVKRKVTFIIGDPGLDVALIKVEKDINLPASELLCEEPTRVIGTAMGLPYGTDFVEVKGSVGVYEIPNVLNWKHVVIFMGAVIPGMSGGPVFNEDGEIIAIIVGLAGNPETGRLGLVVPANRICQELFPLGAG